MAGKSAAQTESERAQVIEESLDDLEKAIDRLKSMYEQYFLGIAKTAPAFVHNEVDRKIRDMTQANIRSTRLRYKFVTLNQKFSSYNSYWRRTLREIESGKYIRSLQKIGREAVRSGDAIPEEILAAMPKRMREQVIRDREAALATAARRGKLPGAEFATEESTQEDANAELLDLGAVDEDLAAVIREPTDLRRKMKPAPNRPHQLTKADAEFDLDAFFAQVENEPDENTNVKQGIPKPPAQPAPPPQPARITGQALPAASRTSAQPPMRPSEAALRTGAQPPMRPSEAALRTGAQPPIRPPATPDPAAPPSSPGIARIQTRASAPAITGQPRAAAPPAVPPRPPAAPQTQLGLQPPKSMLPAQTMPGIQPAKPAAAPAVKPPAVTQPIPVQVATQPMPRVPSVPGVARIASQSAKPLPVQPGATESRPTPVVESVSSGQFKRAAAPAAPGLKPPPGMSDADVNALHANYIKAKQLVGEDAGPGSRDKLLRTINAQAPKIMDQYKVGSVDFSVVVKDNQVIIRAKPKGKP